jgi:hypothetical protein
MGFNALDANTSGWYNTAIGADALSTNTSGAYNTAMGAGSLNLNSTGINNTAHGYYALGANTIGDHNTANGWASLRWNTTGSNNTANGEYALKANITGGNNTALGYASGYSNTAGSGNVFIGYNAGYNELGSNKLYIANSSTNPPLIYGDFAAGNVGFGTITPGAKIEVAGQVKITGGTPGVGKVLTSDGGGLAAWETASNDTYFTSLNNAFTTVTTVPTQLTIGVLTFTKLYSSTKVELNMVSRVNAGIFAGGATRIKYELRIDGVAIAASNPWWVYLSAASEYVTIHAVVPGLTTGAHLVQVWANTDLGSSTMVVVDPGGFGGKIFVTERH